MNKIVHITTVHYRDDTRIFIKEAKSLAAHFPCKVLMMVADGKGNIDDKEEKVTVYDLGRIRGGRLARMLKGPWRALLAINSIKPAVVHFHDPELIPLGVLLKMIRYKVVYDVHEDVPLQTINKHYIPVFARYPVALIINVLECLFARICDAIVAATPKIANRFPARKTVIIQNFPIIDELAASVSIPHDKRPSSFAYVGGIASIRGAVEIICAFEKLNDIHNAKLDLAGTFSPHNIVDKLRELSGWSFVNYHGQISRAKVAKILCGARAGLVILHPIANYIDSYPIKMFEYMSASLPVIASDFPLWRRIIDGVGCGLLVDPLSSKAIANAMRWVLEHPREAEDMGRRGREAVERIYNWDSEAKKLLNLYDKLLHE